MTRTEPVYVDTEGAVAELVLNRPSKLNAIDEAVLLRIEAAVDEVETSEVIRVLLLRGEGRAFCAGADLHAAGPRVEDPELLADHAAIWRRVLDRLACSPVPSIAAVHGVCVAGGLELVLACDMLVLAEDARIGDGHANWGLFPSGGATQRLPRLVGPRRASWLLFSGEPLPPDEALAAGLANAVVPADRLLPTARDMAATLARRSPASIANMKQAVRRGLDAGSLQAGLDLEQTLLAQHMTSEDVRIGVDAFTRRTVPDFVGR